MLLTEASFGTQGKKGMFNIGKGFVGGTHMMNERKGSYEHEQREKTRMTKVEKNGNFL
jgi:hypothetical protein